MGHHPGWMNDFTGTVGRHHLVYTYIGASKIMWASNHMSVIIVGSGPMSWWHSRQSHAPLDLHKLFYMFIMCSQILVQLWFLAMDHWALSGTHIPYVYHKPLKFRVCKWRVLVITDGRLVANACMYMKYNCSCARCSTCVCLWGSFVCVYLLWEEGQCTETWPKGLWDRVTMAALYPQLIPLLFDVPLYMYGYVHTCCPSTYIALKVNSCIDSKALPVWHLYRYYTRERRLFLCYWRARI